MLEGFCLGNIIKYLYRYKLKGNPVQDLMKAREYLERLIICVKNKMNEEQRILNDNKTHNTAYWKEKDDLIRSATECFRRSSTLSDEETGYKYGG